MEDAPPPVRQDQFLLQLDGFPRTEAAVLGFPFPGIVRVVVLGGQVQAAEIAPVLLAQAALDDAAPVQVPCPEVHGQILQHGGQQGLALGQLGLGFLAGGDVHGVADKGDRAPGALPHRFDDGTVPAEGAVLVPHPVLGLGGVGVIRGRPGELGLAARQILGVDEFSVVLAEDFFGLVPEQRLPAGGDEGKRAVAGEGVDDALAVVDDEAVFLLGLQQGGLVAPDGGMAREQPDEAQRTDDGVHEGQPEALLLRHGVIRLQRHRDADAADDVALPVALGAVALEARLFGDERAHQPEKRPPVHVFPGRGLPAACGEGLQGQSFPSVRGVLGPQGFEAGDVPAQPVPFLAQFVDLAGHVGRVDQGQALASRGFDIAVRDMPEMGVGRGGL